MDVTKGEGSILFTAATVDFVLHHWSPEQGDELSHCLHDVFPPSPPVFSCFPSKITFSPDPLLFPISVTTTLRTLIYLSTLGGIPKTQQRDS